MAKMGVKVRNLLDNLLLFCYNSRKVRNLYQTQTPIKTTFERKKQCKKTQKSGI